MQFSQSRVSGFIALIVLSGSMACTRNTIEFGTVPENNYTRLVYIDTVGIKLSTVLTDSFTTGGASTFLLGKYKDPYLGIVSTGPFLQIDKPPTVETMPTGSFFDSLELIIKLNEYYYGDTTKQETITVNELAQTPVAPVGGFYNTSNISVKPTPLGSKLFRLRPIADDSVHIKLDNSKGSELFDKLKSNAAEITSSDNFLNYFKGISIKTGVNDTAAVFGIAGSMVLRLHYHTTIPNQERHYIDFPSLSNLNAFNQILSNRTGTGIVSGISGVTEIPSSSTNNLSFFQSGTGLDLKMTFPSLRNILLTNSHVKLLRADLLVRPAFLSYDLNKYQLPSSLALAYTDASNILNGNIPDSSGHVLETGPVIDYIYGQDTYYKFNITSYINQLLSSSGTEKNGLYVTDGSATTRPVSVTRMLVGSTAHDSYATQLQLSVLIVNQ